MAERATRQMLDGIAAFRDAYKDNPRFKSILGQLDTIEEEAEKLVPAAYDRTPDAADEPKNLKDASARARQELRDARSKGAAEDSAADSDADDKKK